MTAAAVSPSSAICRIIRITQTRNTPFQFRNGRRACLRAESFGHGLKAILAPSAVRRLRAAGMSSSRPRRETKR